MATRGWQDFTAADAARHNARLTGGTLSRGVRTGAGVPVKARSKYGAVPTMVDGIRFDSAAEARRYGELKVRERVGEIVGLRCQPQFKLFALKVSRDTSGYLGAYVGDYVADFEYVEVASKAVVVEDVKGVRTPLYRLKKKIAEACHGIQIIEVR